MSIFQQRPESSPSAALQGKRLRYEMKIIEKKPAKGDISSPGFSGASRPLPHTH
jgi:hypothetical protein